MRLSKIKGVFERRTSTGSEAFSFLICHDATKLFLPILYSYRDDLTENMDKTTSDRSGQSLSTTVLSRTTFTRTIRHVQLTYEVTPGHSYNFLCLFP